MSSLESIIQSAASKFGLGEKSALLVSELLELIIDEYNGGLGGFIERLKRAGLSELVNSWVKIGPNNEISESELEKALGAQAIQNIASKTGVALHTAKSSLAYVLPAVIDFLTPNGMVPTSIPHEIRSFIRKEERARVDAAHDAAKHGSSIWRWLLPLLILLALAFFGYRYCSAPKTDTATAPTTTADATKPESWLTLINEGGKLGFSGIVPDEKTKDEIIARLKAVFGDNLVGEIKVDPNYKPVNWLAKLEGLLAALIPGAEVSIEGNSVHVGGNIGAELKATLLDKLKSLFGTDFNIIEGFVDVEARIKESIEETLAALKALLPGHSAEDLVNALNLHIIHFATGSAEIPAANQEVLKESAKAIKNAPAGTKLEVSGHTDDVGAEDMNQKLSDARANAVRDFLVKEGVAADVLTAKGYGETAPVTTNATPEGRFANRRIEYKVVK
ncbi:MAG: YidB family protein [Blastocatellales bacterium]